MGSWLLFGSRLDASGTPTATVWSSPDGTAWTAAALGPTPTPGQALAAAQYKASTVAVGSTGVGAAQQASVWLATSIGGAFAPQSVPTSDGPSSMNLVTTGSLGMFATGTVDGRFAMWSSANGRAWSEIPSAEKAVTASPGARVNALLAEGDQVLAAGSVESGSGTAAAIWSSTDGTDWHLLGNVSTSFAGPGQRIIYSLAPLGTGIVAVGAVNNGAGWQPASWISPDGVSWSLPALDFPGTPDPAPSLATFGPSGGTSVRSVSAVPTVAGTTSVVATGGGPYGQQAWQSTDGLHWTSLALPATASTVTSWRAEVAAATVTTDLVFDAEPGQPYLLRYEQPGTDTPGPAAPEGWTEPSSNPAAFGPVAKQAVPVSLQDQSGQLDLTVDVVTRPQVIGPASEATAYFSSVNGTSWAAVPAGFPSARPATLPALGAVFTLMPDGWVAVASTPGSTPEVWVSTDGQNWQRAASLTGPPGVTPGPSAAESGSSGGTTVTGVCSTRVAATQAAGAHYVAAAVGSGAHTVAATGSSSSSASNPTGVLATTTRSAEAWASPDGTVWRSATVDTSPPPGATQSMSGCLATGSNFTAFGMATAPNGDPVPGLWRSPDGISWNRVSVSAFTPGTPTPLVAVAEHNGMWLGAANPDPGADPATQGEPGGPGPAATAGTDGGVGPAATIENGRSGLWLSPAGASGWQQIDTSAAPWLGTEWAQVDLVGFADSATVHASTGTTPESPAPPTTAVPAGSTVPVVVGVVDGQLAVWTGTPSVGGA